MPHTQRQQADSRGRGLLSLLLLLPILLLLLSSLSPQPSQAALLIPPNFKKPPVITAQPESITVFGAEDIGLTCDATANPPPAFRWTKDGEEFIPSDDPGLTVSKGSGTFYAAAGAALGPMKQYQGKYTCYASNELGTAVSSEVQLTTDQPPALQKERKVKKKAEEGESVVLKCNPPISTMEPVIHWMDRRLRHLQLSERVMLGKDGNLYFAHVTLDDSRSDYTCNVQYLAARTILPKEPITLTVSASNSVVRNRRPQMMSPTDTHSTYLALRGQTLELECIVQGLPTPSVQWVRKDGQLSESRVTRDQFDRRLRLTDIAEGDGGEYQCIANNTQGKVKHTYIVSVEAAPRWTKTPVSQVYAPGETVRLDCQADGIPSPTFSWSINGLPLSSVDPESRRSVVDGVLILEEVKFGDTAVYQCQAQNKHGTILINTNVFVIELPPQILSQDGRTYTAVNGQRAELDCDSFGSPRPTVSWESEGAPSLLADPRVNLLTNGSLQITNVSHGDSALYTCSVGKGNQSISISAELEVLNRTVILSPPQDLRVQPGMVAIFTCLYRVDPKLNPPLIQWRKSGQKIFPSYDEDKFTFEGPDLMVASVQTEDEGVYTCEVITDLDMAEASGSITVVDRPGPPTMLQLSDPEERSVTLSWTPGEDHNSPVLEYVVEFEDQSVTGLGWEELDRVGGDQESAVLTLWPYMSYHFRVVAVNDIGISEPSAPSDLHSTPPQVPDDNPEDVRSESMHPETLLITWEKMDKRRFNGPAFRYRVFWRRVVGSGPAWHSNVTAAPPFVVTSGVGNFSAFEIKVQAVNQNGEGPAPDPVIGYSGEDLPLEAPMGVGVELMNSTAIKVMWAAVNRETVRGHLLGYKIRLTRFGSRGRHRGRREWEPEVTTVVETGATEEKRVIGGLRPYSHYALTTSVVNSKGEGPPSESLPFMTEEGAPGRPMSLHLESPGETVMTLRWTPPAQPNGILTGYLLQYQQIVDSEDSPMQMENINNHSVTQLTLEGLDPHSRYRFYLRGRTSAGEGEPIIKDGATMLDGAPPSNFSLSVGDKSLNLSWVSKERQQSVGFQIHYLNKNGGGKWKLTEKVNSSRTFYQLQGLTPGSLYRVKVTFNNSTVWETDIQTEGTGVVEEQMSFATQGWFIVLVCVLVLLLLVLLSLCFIKRNKGGKYSVKDKEEGQVDSEARPMKDETFGEYSDLEEKRTASQPSLCDDSKLCTSEDNLDEYNGSSAVTEVNMDSSLVSQYSRMPSEGPDAGPGLESSPLNPAAADPAANGVPNSSAILDDILTSLTSNPGLEEQNMI